MPTTAQNITLIEARVNYSRAEILTLLDELQLIVYRQRTDETLKIDSSTGRPPYLATTEDQYRYNCPSDCWMTQAIFSEEPIRRYRTTADHGESTTYYWQNKSYHNNPVTQTMKTVDTVATVTFEENPGTTTQKFFHAYWIDPTRLTDESIELTLPEHVHYTMRRGLQAMLSSEDFGQTSFDDNVLEKVAKVIRRELNRGARGRLGKTPIKQEFLDWNNTDAGLWL